MAAAAVRAAVNDYGCHPNFGGVVLGDGGGGVAAVATAASALRATGYMFLPLTVAAPDVPTAVQLAALGAPLSAVSLPKVGSSDPRGSAQAALRTLAALGAASANVSNAMTMAVTLDACDATSDSLARFAANALK